MIAKVRRDGPTPLLAPVPGMSERERLRLAMVIPTFSRGSGGHNTLFQIFSRLERRGHVCSTWLVDPHIAAGTVWPAVLRDEVREYFAPFEGPRLQGLRPLAGGRRRDRHRLADGPRDARSSINAAHGRMSSTTTSPSSSRPPQSMPSAPRPTRYGMHCIAASPWLRDLLIDRYGASAEAFELGVDHDVYRAAARRAPTRHGRSTTRATRRRDERSRSG